jgi:hypothetical protein
MNQKAEMEMAAKERKEKEVTPNPACSVAHLMGTASISPEGLHLRSLCSFAAYLFLAKNSEGGLKAGATRSFSSADYADDADFLLH